MGIMLFISRDNIWTSYRGFTMRWLKRLMEIKEEQLKSEWRRGKKLIEIHWTLIEMLEELKGRKKDGNKKL